MSWTCAFFDHDWYPYWIDHGGDRWPVDQSRCCRCHAYYKLPLLAYLCDA